jgi:hypothetical protein
MRHPDTDNWQVLDRMTHDSAILCYNGWDLFLFVVAVFYWYFVGDILLGQRISIRFSKIGEK